MRAYILIIALLASVALARAQSNMLQNGSFENPSSSEPSTIAEVDNCDVWETRTIGTTSGLNPNHTHSPDWVTSKTNIGNFRGTLNTQSFAAADGDNYVHIGPAELIQQKLTSTNEPEQGETYVLSFYARPLSLGHFLSTAGGGGPDIGGSAFTPDLGLKAFLKKSRMKYDEEDAGASHSLNQAPNIAYVDYESLNNSQQIVSIADFQNLTLDQWNYVEVEFTADDDGYDWFIMDVVPPDASFFNRGILIDDIKMRKGCLEKCKDKLLYENRSSANYNPLPKLAAAKEIETGEDVDPNTTNGEVVQAAGEVVEFKASKAINLRAGTQLHGQFTGTIVPSICDNPDYDCTFCCDDWQGFAQNLGLMNVMTINGDGINDIWQVTDFNNPNCAYNALGYELHIYSRWDGFPCQGNGDIYRKSYMAGPGECCPLVSPNSNSDPTIASISWDGKTLNPITGNWVYVNAGTYFYCVKLKGCDGSVKEYSGSILVDFGGPVPQEDQSLSQQEDLENILLEVYPIPARDILNVSLKGTSQINSVELIDLNGKVLISKSFNGGQHIQLKTAGLPAGVYSLSLTTDGRVFRKVVSLK